MQRSVLLAGSTGLIGSRVLQLLARNPSMAGPIVAPVRRQREVESSRVVQVVQDLGAANADALTSAVRKAADGWVDTYISCLGTTMKKAGSEAAFLAVDRDLVLRFARMARDLGAAHAILVSSVGADRTSSNFYLRVKGEVEDQLGELEFDCVDIFRPGLLLGARDESRPGERFAQILAPILNPLLMGPLNRYRAIGAADVASAIANVVVRRGSGCTINDWSEIRRLAGQP